MLCGLRIIFFFFFFIYICLILEGHACLRTVLTLGHHLDPHTMQRSSRSSVKLSLYQYDKLMILTQNDQLGYTKVLSSYSDKSGFTPGSKTGGTPKPSGLNDREQNSRHKKFTPLFVCKGSEKEVAIMWHNTFLSNIDSAHSREIMLLVWKTNLQAWIRK